MDADKDNLTDKNKNKYNEYSIFSGPAKCLLKHMLSIRITLQNSSNRYNVSISLAIVTSKPKM